MSTVAPGQSETNFKIWAKYQHGSKILNGRGQRSFFFPFAVFLHVRASGTRVPLLPVPHTTMTHARTHAHTPEPNHPPHTTTPNNNNNNNNNNRTSTRCDRNDCSPCDKHVPQLRILADFLATSNRPVLRCVNNTAQLAVKCIHEHCCSKQIDLLQKKKSTSKWRYTPCWSIHPSSALSRLRWFSPTIHWDSCGNEMKRWLAMSAGKPGMVLKRWDTYNTKQPWLTNVHTFSYLVIYLHNFYCVN